MCVDHATITQTDRKNENETNGICNTMRVDICGVMCPVWFSSVTATTEDRLTWMTAMMGQCRLSASNSIYNCIIRKSVPRDRKSNVLKMVSVTSLFDNIVIVLYEENKKWWHIWLYCVRWAWCGVMRGEMDFSLLRSSSDIADGRTAVELCGFRFGCCAPSLACSHRPMLSVNNNHLHYTYA